MSDIGWRAHPDYRGEQSLNVIAHAALAGVDHPGRLFIGLAVYFRHVGPGESAPDDFYARIKRLIDKRALKRARILGAALRTAHMISIGMAGIIDETPLSYEDGKLVLTIPPAYALLEGERLRRRFDSLAQLVEWPGEIRILR
jgi:exopolyphosphatase/guanosine-5'-triphosphate,3'-diphosphate pyrophosphatase